MAAGNKLLLEIDDNFEKIINCIDNRGWDKYFSTLSTSMSSNYMFSELLIKEFSTKRGGDELQDFYNTLDKKVFPLFNEHAPKEFSKKETFKLLLCAVFQMNETEPKVKPIDSDELKKIINNFVNELSKLINKSSTNGVSSDPKPIGNEIQSTYEKTSFNVATKYVNSLKTEEKTNSSDKTKLRTYDLLSKTIDIESVLAPEGYTNRNWYSGEVPNFDFNNTNEDNTFLKHIFLILKNANTTIEDFDTLVSKDIGLNVRLRSSIPENRLAEKRASIKNFYDKNKVEIERFEKDVFSEIKQYIETTIDNVEIENSSIVNESLENSLTTKKKAILNALRLESDEGLNLFIPGVENSNGGEINDLKTSYRIILLRAILTKLRKENVLSVQNKNDEFISEMLLRSIQENRQLTSHVNIEIDSVILIFLYSIYGYISTCVVDLVSGQEKNYINICKKYKFHDSSFFTKMDNDELDEKDKIRMSLAYAFNNKAYF